MNEGHDKQYILQEIRRTALENGNTPLGKARFFKETGIRETDWSGKYWARWNDAVEEAGFTPNRKNARLDDAYLIQPLILLIRELGSFPTAAEMQIKRRNDSSFPSSDVFLRRLARGRKQLACIILDFCKEKTGYSDVIDIIANSSLKITTDTKNSDSPNLPKEGSVYLIKSGRYYKIGRSNSYGRREYEIKLQLPDKAMTIHSIKTDDPVGIESYWHNRFKDKRKNGEWFELNSIDIQTFKRRKFM